MPTCDKCGPEKCEKWNTCTQCGRTEWAWMFVGYAVTSALIASGVAGYCFLEDRTWRIVVGLSGVGLGGVQLVLGGLATFTAIAALKRVSGSGFQEGRSELVSDNPQVREKKSGNRCRRCNKEFGVDWHYRFESILAARIIALQCPDCGDILCDDDAKEGNRELIDCPKCNKRLIWLMEGPAASSMVDKARREKRYRGPIQEPKAQGRPVEFG